MLLTITYRGESTSDLGYLLHKNPDRTQKFDLSFGNAYVFYPTVSNNITTAAILLDINPIDLARGKLGSRDGGLFDYVNDRPYVCSSFMSTALNKVFSTAINGRCEKKPELVMEKLDLEANVTMLPCKGDKELIQRIFKPLGYEITFDNYILDDKFPRWGESSYVNLKLSAKIRLCDLLNHLYVLIPVFDKRKHYWITKDEVEKLLKHGEGWLSEHPEKHLITQRYLHSRKTLVNLALIKLYEDKPDDEDDEVITEDEDIITATTPRTTKKSLNDRRLEAVVKAVIDNGAKRVIDIGCGEGKLISLLLSNPKIQKVTGVDVSILALERAKSRLNYDRMPEYKKAKLELLQGSLTYKDKRFCGYDAVCVIEVIEHLEPTRLTALKRVLFEFTAPPVVIMSTPNVEYNVNYERLNAGAVRDSDHRFEWTRREFRDFANDICDAYGYSVEFFDIGDMDEEHGAPTQMGVFKRCE